jgi:outer membrane protein
MKPDRSILLAAALLAACGATRDELAGRAVDDASPAVAPAADPAGAPRPDEVPGEAGSGPLPRDLTIAQAVAEALAHNRTVQQARLDVAIGFDDAQEARAALIPTVSLAGSYNAVDQPRQINTGGTPITTAPKDLWALGVSVDFPIFAFGRHLNTWRAAQLRRQGAESVQRAVEADTAAAVTAAAFDVLETMQAIEVARSDEEALAQQMRDAQAQLDAGSATKVAVLEASVEHDAAKRTREKLESLVPLRKMLLNKLLGRPADGPIEVADEPETRAPIWQLEPLVEEALDRRPEIQSARLEVAAAQRALEATIGAELGELRGNVLWDTDDNPFRAPSDQLNFLVTLEVPIFTGGARTARIRRARHLVESASIAVRDLEADVRTQVAQAYRDAVEAYRDIGVAKSAVVRQEESVRIQREKFKNGRATSREVLDSVALLRNASFAVVNATYSYNIALRELLRARGADPRLDPFFEVGKAGGPAAPPEVPAGAPGTQGRELEEAIRRAAPVPE